MCFQGIHAEFFLELKPRPCHGPTLPVTPSYPQKESEIHCPVEIRPALVDIFGTKKTHWPKGSTRITNLFVLKTLQNTIAHLSCFRRQSSQYIHIFVHCRIGLREFYHWFHEVRCCCCCCCPAAWNVERSVKRLASACSLRKGQVQLPRKHVLWYISTQWWYHSI